MFGLPQAIILLVAVQRLLEMRTARRNAKLLLAQGGIEYGQGHYPLLVLLHAAWLVTLFVAVAPGQSIDWGLLAAYGLLQGLRYWVVVSLGPYWTTRIISVPGAPLVRRGPYRYIRHPNYVVVVAEIALLPLVFGAWQIALVFSALNALILAWRIKVEDRALASRRNDGAAESL